MTISKREAIIGLGLAIGGTSVFSVKPRPSSITLVNLDDLPPERVGQWKISKSHDLSIPQPSNYTRSIYEKMSISHYLSPNIPPVTLLMAYGRAQSYSSQLHRPEICYPASGFKIAEKEDIVLSIETRLIPAGFLKASRGRRRDAVLYWTRIGDTFPLSLLEQRIQIAKAALERREQDGIVFRLSMPLDNGIDAFDTLRAFASEFYSTLSDEGKKVLLGQQFT